MIDAARCPTCEAPVVVEVDARDRVVVLAHLDVERETGWPCGDVSAWLRREVEELLTDTGCSPALLSMASHPAWAGRWRGEV